MSVSGSDHLAAALKAQSAAMVALTSVAFECIRKITEVNLQAAKTGFTEQQSLTALLTSKDPQGGWLRRVLSPNRRPRRCSRTRIRFRQSLLRARLNSKRSSTRTTNKTTVAPRPTSLTSSSIFRLAQTLRLRCGNPRSLLRTAPMRPQSRPRRRLEPIWLRQTQRARTHRASEADRYPA